VLPKTVALGSAFESESENTIVVSWSVWSKALSESVFSVLQEGHQGNKGLSAFQLLHRNHENGLLTDGKLP
jgi:hypothetical protein